MGGVIFPASSSWVSFQLPLLAGAVHPVWLDASFLTFLARHASGWLNFRYRGSRQLQNPKEKSDFELD